MKKTAIEITQGLREATVRADIELTGRKLRKALDYAGKLGVPYVVLVGKKDLEAGKVTLRDMKSGEQKSIEKERAVEEILNILGV